MFYPLLAYYGWPGVAVALGGGLLAFQIIKQSARPILAAGVIGIGTLAVWWFWPSRAATAAPNAAPAVQRAKTDYSDIIRRRRARRQAWQRYNQGVMRPLPSRRYR